MKAFSGILILILTIYSAHANAQNTISKNSPFPQTDQVERTSGESCLIPNEYELSIPDIAEDASPQSYTFLVKNICDKEVRVTEVVNSCSCLTTQIPDSIFGPGEEKEIILTFNPYKKKGDIFQEAFIYTDMYPDESDFSLRIIGKIKPSEDPYYHYSRKVGVLRFRRKFMTFKFTEESQWITERLVCVNSSDREISIKGTLNGEELPSYIEIKSEPKVIQPGQEADIIVSINNEKLPERDDEFIIAIEGVDAQPGDKGLLMKIENRIKK